jgi:phosphatidate cytidylyltransferase
MKRVVPGILLALCWFFLLFKGSITLFAAVIAVVAIWATDEYVRMAGGQRFSTLQRILLDIILPLPLFATMMTGDAGTGALYGLLFAFGLLAIFTFATYADFADSYDLFCRLAFGTMYLGVLSAFILGLRLLPEGGGWLLVVTAITAGSDTGAYYIGRAYGKSKLCPVISPNQTWAGAVGGFAFGVPAAVLFAGMFLVDPPWLFITIAAILLTGAGIAGDLTESIIKRGTGVKDSGHCLGGHGGILDRIDSLLFCGPLLYFLLVVVR